MGSQRLELTAFDAVLICSFLIAAFLLALIVVVVLLRWEVRRLELEVVDAALGDLDERDRALAQLDHRLKQLGRLYLELDDRLDALAHAPAVSFRPASAYVEAVDWREALAEAAETSEPLTVRATASVPVAAADLEERTAQVDPLPRWEDDIDTAAMPIFDGLPGLPDAPELTSAAGWSQP